MFFVNGLSPASIAMLLVLTSAIAALWLRLLWTLVCCLLAVLAFNWFFISPRGTLAVQLQEDAILLLVMFVVSMLVAALTSALHEHARQLGQQAQAIATLRAWGDALRDAANPLDCLPRLRDLLQEATASADAAVLALRENLPDSDDADAALLIGDVNEEQRSGLWHCLRSGNSLGSGSGRYENLHDFYLPMRGRTMGFGAAIVFGNGIMTEESLSQAQALCDQLGIALERQHGHKQRQLSDQLAREQELRATLLAAIAHDYRTPLATMMSAASAIEQQDDKLTQTQRGQLAHRIVEECSRLRQLTANILQIARVDAPGVQLRCDWETAEELVAGAMHNCRQPQRLQITVAHGLPLLWCDALLITQMLDNLLDNACKFSPPDSKVQLSVRSESNGLIFAVSDEGPGIPLELQQRIFLPFRQGQALASGVKAAKHSGVGIGLALCRVVAVAHGGELRLHSSESGSCFEFSLPHKPQPSYPAAADNGKVTAS